MSAPTRSFVLLAGALAAGPLAAQGGLRGRVEAAADARVQFRYAARADVCGQGSAIQVGTNTYVSTGGGMSSYDGLDRIACRRGPVVARVTRAGGTVVGVEVEIAPDAVPEGVTDLGLVPAAQAAEYLLDLAARADGRPARQAILPAVLADSVDVSRGLLTLAKNRELARSVRDGAMNWLGRELDRLPAEPARLISAALIAMASDGEEPLPVRQQALSVLARAQRADLAALTRLAGGTDSWLRQAAIQALANSGDPRAREFMRAAFQDPALPEPLRATVIRGLGRDYATPRDLELLRSRFPTLASSNAKQAVISVMGEQGGAANLQWLLGIAGDAAAAPETRSQAVEAALRAGATTPQLTKLYSDAPDRRGKESAAEALFRRGDREAVDNLIKIARTETDPSVRRSVISRLGRMDDPRVRDLLKDLVAQ